MALVQFCKMGKSIQPILIISENRKNSIVFEWVILLICFGYPLQTLFVVGFREISFPINAVFRGLYFIFCMYFVVIGLLRKPFRLIIPAYIFLIFWSFYGIRLIYDMEFRDIRYMAESNFYVYAFAFGGSMIPALVVFLNAHIMNVSRFAKTLFYLLIIDNIIIIICMIALSPEGLKGVLANRQWVYLQVEEGSKLIFNPITISYFGELLSLLMITIIFFKKELKLKINLIFLLLAIVIGLFNLTVGASRGPVLGFLLMVLILLLIKFYSSRTTLVKYIHWKFNSGVRPIWASWKIWLPGGMFVVVIAGLIFIMVSKETILELKIPIITRIIDLTQPDINIKKEGRYYEWSSAWQQIKENPFLGDSFVNTFDKAYAHNLILDSLMSTGIIGTIFFLMYIIFPFLYYFRLLCEKRNKYITIWIVFLPILLLSLTSGGLFASYDFWIFSAMIIGLLHEEGEMKKMETNQPSD